jgi:hypothetical protein
MLMAAIVRDALAQEFNDVASLNVKAYREYSYALTSDNIELPNNLGLQYWRYVLKLA